MVGGTHNAVVKREAITDRHLAGSRYLLLKPNPRSFRLGGEGEQSRTMRSAGRRVIPVPVVWWAAKSLKRVAVADPSDTVGLVSAINPYLVEVPQETMAFFWPARGNLGGLVRALPSREGRERGEVRGGNVGLQGIMARRRR